MTHTKFILFAILLYFSSFSKALTITPVASLVLSSPVVSSKLTHFTSTNTTNSAYTTQTTIGGSACRQIAIGKYAYFNVDDLTIDSTKNNLIFCVTYYDSGVGTLYFDYNANDGSNTRRISITKTASNTWIKATIPVTNAALRNLQNNNCDFRLSGDTQNYIKEITIAIGVVNAALEVVPTATSSTYSEFVGKSVAGYQVWFKAAASLTAGWVHWSGTKAPATNTSHFEIYPDVTEYAATDLNQTALANLGNGNPSVLFTSGNKTVIDKHFQWMKDYGIDGVALQRFINNIEVVNYTAPNSAIMNVKNAAEATGRIFYICYDISGASPITWDEQIKNDWVYNVEQTNKLTASPAYAKVGNRPVVQIWGTGFLDNHPGTATETVALIKFLQSRGCYVIGGVPAYWRTDGSDAKGPDKPLPQDQESFQTVYAAYDMISPWLAGRFKDDVAADNFTKNVQISDKALCDSRSIKYMPEIFPGFAWSQWNTGAVNATPRRAGEFMWNQAVNIKGLGLSNMYFGMFDEYDEGTAIMKNATDWSMIPTDQYFLTSSADGYWCSSDFQLRVAQAAIEMLKGTRAIKSTVPVPHSNGPVYYRNSFEKRFTRCNYDALGVAQDSGIFNIDPCFLNAGIQWSSNVTSPICDIQNLNPKSGLYSVKTTGTITTTAPAMYYYKIADAKIAVKANIKLSFWKRTDDNLGRYVSVDMISKKGKTLKDNGYKDQLGNSISPVTPHGTVGAGWEQFTCNFGNGILLGDTITGIIIGYEHTGAGSYTAYFDDFQIDDGTSTNAVENILSDTSVMVVRPNAMKGEFELEVKVIEPFVMYVYDSFGKQLMSRNSSEAVQKIDLSNSVAGTYIVTVVLKDKKYTQKIIKF